MIVAVMFANNPINRNDVSFGTSLSILRHEYSSDGIDRKLLAFLNSKEENVLIENLRSLVRMAASKKIALNWLDLLVKMTSWHSEDFWVQNKIARDFWRVEEQQEETIVAAE
jgi:CRISPR type I-E-associated protein CasB/Cse2